MALALAGVAGTAAASAPPTKVIATIRVGDSPLYAAITPDGSSVYVVNVNGNSVSVVDTASNTVKATIPVGQMPWDVAVTPDGSTVYVANRYSNSVSVISTATNTITRTISGLGSPSSLAVTHDGSELWVSTNSTITVVSTATHAVVQTIAQDSVEIALSPDEHYVYALGYRGSLAVLDRTAGNAKVATISTPSDGSDLAVTPDGSKVYVANGQYQSASVIDTTTNTVTKTIPTGPASYNLAIMPDGSHVFVSAGNGIAVISTATDTVASFAPVHNPYGAVFTPDGAYAYVTDNGLNSVNVLAVPPPLPVVTGISPASGPAAGGTTVTITGTDLSGATSVTFGTGHPATDVSCSATSCTATAPAGTAGTVDVQVTTPNGTSAAGSADRYTYIAYPVVTGVSPDSGPLAGGTTVTITGTGLSGATSVTFGTGHPATDVSCSATSCTATAPAGTAGAVDVQVTTPGGTSVAGAAARYTYVAQPAVTTVSPTSGPALGGTKVTITGTNLGGTTAVHFGSTPAASFTVTGTTSITATAPAGTGTVDITVTTPNGTSTSQPDDRFTYIPAPVVSAVSPASGPATGGTQVTITGTGFTGASAVHFGATPATSFTVTSATSITATAPAGVEGTVDVTVTTDNGTSATGTAAQYTYVAAPTLTALSPSNGASPGGNQVTITGTGFTGATAVTFGGTAATSFTVTSSTSITAVAPAGTAGTSVDVAVTTIGGTGTAKYTYNRDTTSLTASPILLNLQPGPLNLTLNLSATLTDTTTGRPVPGQNVVFTVGSTTVCSGTTDVAGTAECAGVVPVLTALLALHYNATFAGTPALAPATATGALIRL
ncbi:IPT/TIG domain-containing protein [Streptomyces sp. NPDC004327]|uniref:IPT/TIG domain-containing protein n=1 Tax=Streptomyces sp. NPDC004327 TaxID=3364699 RepID=UPI0036A704F9